MALVIVEDDLSVLPGIPSGAGASFYEMANALPRIFVIDDLDAAGGWGYTSAPICDGSDAGTLVAVYNDSLARVELTGTIASPPWTFVEVERSTDQQHWTTVRGGISIDVTSGGFTLNDYEFTNGVVNYYRFNTLAPFGCGSSNLVSITPVLTKIWIKSINRPFLNLSMSASCIAFGGSDPEMLGSTGMTVTRRARSAVFPVINRTYGVAVNDLRVGREWTINLRTFTDATLRSVDFLFASGDVLLVQTPSGCAETLQTGYVTAFDVSYERHHRKRRRAVWTVPVQEVAPPGPDIVYAEATWQTVLNLYGSWAAVMAANPTWAAVLALLPQPSEVIVP